LLEPMALQIECSRERVKSIVEQQLGYLSNWKTPGPDHVFNFFIKKMYALHDTLADLMCNAVEEPETIDDPLYVGNTYLIPKVKEAKEGKDFRPITCLPMMYKLLSKVVTT